MADYPDQPQYEVTYDDDPIGFLKMQSDTLQKHVQHTQAQLQQERLSNYQQNINNQITNFKREHDDYDEAFSHMVKARRQELSDGGVSDPAKQDETLNAEAWDIANKAMSEGTNPAEVAYGMSKELGYKSPVDRDAFDALNDTEIDDVFEEMERANFEETGASIGIRSGW